jgi:hypothetical protein
MIYLVNHIIFSSPEAIIAAGGFAARSIIITSSTTL